MNQSNKKITNQDLVNLIVDMKKDMNQRFDTIEKDIVDIKKDIVDIKKDIFKINSKIDLIISCPTIQREIDHDALAEIDAR